jgi:uncharacterized delta-60 repeat protein
MLSAASGAYAVSPADKREASKLEIVGKWRPRAWIVGVAFAILLSPQVSRAVICGDGVVDAGEQCDDGNTSNGDGCSASCAVENGWECVNAPSLCAPVCGDGLVVGSEQCDDGNLTNGDGCDDDPAHGGNCTDTACGNGVVSPGEECDDNNTMVADGCSATCTVEAGWQCTGTPSVCTGILCGDGLPAGTEECDDGNSNNNDLCKNDCTQNVCGDGVLNCGPDGICGTGDDLEQCDDGNVLDGDGCSSTCQIAALPTPTMPMPVGTCGDGFREDTEECDDGNLLPGDGCSATCVSEVFPALQPQPLYSDDFESSGLDPRWSIAWSNGSQLRTGIDVAPANGNHFLGPFDNADSAVLSLRNLAHHSAIAVEFDLFVIGNWAGSNNFFNPSQWGLTADSTPVVATTFNNADPRDGSDATARAGQAYPGTYAGASSPIFPPRTDAGIAGLGFVGSSGGTLPDSVYHIRRTVNHTASSLALTFSSQGLGSFYDTAWGVDNIEVRVAASGDLDPTFGPAGNGVVTRNSCIFTPPYGCIYGIGEIAGVAVQEDDGKIVVTGGDPDKVFALARYSKDGTLDPHFGTDGFVNVPMNDSWQFPGALAVDPGSGKITVAGVDWDNQHANFAFGLARYNPDGTPDVTFGRRSGLPGSVLTNFNGMGGVARALLLQASEKTVAVGEPQSDDGSNSAFGIVRYHASGQPDSTFGTGGKVVTKIGAANVKATALFQGANGAILVGGYGDTTLGQRVCNVVKYQRTGDPDTQFGRGGIAATTGADDQCFGMVNTGVGLRPGSPDADDFVLAGVSDGLFALFGFRGNGTPDPNFGNGGKVTTQIDGGVFNLNGGNPQTAIVRQVDGRLVVAGSVSTSATINTVLIRYNADGSLDTTFGKGGTAMLDLAGDDGARALALQPDGKLVVAGYSRIDKSNDFEDNKDSDWIVERVLASVCGNGVLEPGEACDDGNGWGSDGCSATCQVEKGWVCPKAGKPCSADCGDGIHVSGEECDIGNNNKGRCVGSATGGPACDDNTQCPGGHCQLCDSNCTLERCGNYITSHDESGKPEECDDGNTRDGDTCDGDCSIPRCGNGRVGRNSKGQREGCDDGGTCVNGDRSGERCIVPLTPGADPQCPGGQCRPGSGTRICVMPTAGAFPEGHPCDTDAECTSADSRGQCLPVGGPGCDANCSPIACGNGVRTPGEECDDGNLNNGDSCVALSINGSLECRNARCGDGEVWRAREQCDPGGVCDGGTASGVPCVSNTQCLGGACKPNPEDPTCDATCHIRVTCYRGTPNGAQECYQGILGKHCTQDGECDNPGQPGSGKCEQCDDGDPVNENACTNACTKPRCGDGIISFSAGEQCDDGNHRSGDGCDASCQLECGNGQIDGQCISPLSKHLAFCTSDRDCDSMPGARDGICQSSETCDPGTDPSGAVSCRDLSGQCVSGKVNSECSTDAECETQSGAGDGICSTVRSCASGKSGPCTVDSDCDTTSGSNDGVCGPLRCSNTCTLASCGNGIVECNEDCDEGAANGTDHSNCSANCTSKAPCKKRLGGWALQSSDLTRAVGGKTQVCKENDSCKSADGSCTFHVSFCLGLQAQGDCNPTTLRSVEFLRPTFYNVSPGSVLPKCGEEWREVAVGRIMDQLRLMSSARASVPGRCYAGIKGKFCTRSGDCDTFVGAGDGACGPGVGVEFSSVCDNGSNAHGACFNDSDCPEGTCRKPIGIGVGELPRRCTPDVEVFVPAGKRLRLQARVRGNLSNQSPDQLADVVYDDNRLSLNCAPVRGQQATPPPCAVTSIPTTLSVTPTPVTPSLAPTDTPTPSTTDTLSSTATGTPTTTATQMATDTATNSPSDTPTATPTATATATATQTGTASATPPSSATPTGTSTATATATATQADTASATPPSSATPTGTSTATAAATATQTGTASATPPSSATSTLTSTATLTPTATLTATATQRPTHTRHH